jgi:predicted metalloprotease with PDZ domain
MLRFSLCAASLLLAAATQADIYYTATPNISSRDMRITLKLDEPTGQAAFDIPAWTPGFYFILNYQDKISDFAAADPLGNALEVRHIDRQWVVKNPAKTPITVSYRVTGDDPGLGFFAAHVDNQTAYINGAGTFMYVEGRMTEPCHLKVRMPDGWQVATAMDPDSDEGFEAATGYDEFIDNPVQMGIFERRDGVVEGIPFSVVFVAPRGLRCDADEESARMFTESAPAIRMFGEAPFKRYLYIVHLEVGNFSGGLEHRASNVIAMPNSAPLHLDELATHEYFHAWNVKQIRPSVLGPFDYTKPAITANMWFIEGVTDYYAYMTAHRSGVLPDGWLLDRLGAQIEELQGGHTRTEITLEQSSRRAWESGIGVIGDFSYYVKGLVCGLMFDARIRAETNGAKSLDDVMRLLYKRHKLPQPGMDEDEIRRTINEVAGVDLSELYNRLVKSTNEVPYAELKRMGLRVVSPNLPIRGFGFMTNGNVVYGVSSQADNAGLQDGDRIVSIEGRPFRRIGALANVDASYTAVIDRKGRILTLHLPIVDSSTFEYRLEPDPFADPKAIELFMGWIAR